MNLNFSPQRLDQISLTQIRDCDFKNKKKAHKVDSQLDGPFRDPLWNLAPFQPTAVHKLPRTRAGRGARPCVRATSTLLETRKQRKHHDEARTDARLLRGEAHFFLPPQPPAKHERNKPFWRRRQIQKREKSPGGEKIPRFASIYSVDPYIQSPVAARTVRVKYRRTTSL